MTFDKNRWFREYYQKNKLKMKQNKNRRKNKIPFIKECLICKKSFNDIHGNKKYCSEDCREEAQLIMRRKKEVFDKCCLVCDKPFKTKYNNGKYCSKKCYKQFLQTKYLNSDHSNNNAFLSMRFNILNRDNFRCQYCGRNPKEDNCKLMIDHIIPRAKGGTDNYNNLITSCFECNAGKSDKLLDKHIETKKQGLNL